MLQVKLLLLNVTSGICLIGLTALGAHQRLVSYVERFPLFENRCRTQAKGFSYGCAKSHVSSQEV